MLTSVSSIKQYTLHATGYTNNESIRKSECLHILSAVVFEFTYVRDRERGIERGRKFHISKIDI